MCESRDGRHRPQEVCESRGGRHRPQEVCESRGGRHRPQEVCESRGGRPGLPAPNSPYGLCGRKATFDEEASHN